MLIWVLIRPSELFLVDYSLKLAFHNSIFGFGCVLLSEIIDYFPVRLKRSFALALCRIRRRNKIFERERITRILNFIRALVIPSILVNNLELLFGNLRRQTILVLVRQDVRNFFSHFTQLMLQILLL